MKHIFKKIIKFSKISANIIMNTLIFLVLSMNPLKNKFKINLFVSFLLLKWASKNSLRIKMKERKKRIKANSKLS